MIATVIATYGSEEWRDLAHSRALPSVLAQRENAVVECFHGETLAEARNAGARDANLRAYSHLCFLDADDELAPGYLDAMDASIQPDAAGFRPASGRRLYVPMVEYVQGRKRYRPRFPAEVPYETGNWLVIGTVVPTRLFFEVGGFEEFPLYEDWALFARMQKAGAVPVRVPDAVYVAHRRAGSRNHPTKAEKLAAHAAIRAAVWPEEVAV